MVVLNELQKRDFNLLKSVCINMEDNEGCSNYDIVSYLNDYIYGLSDTISSNFLKYVIDLKDYYYNRLEHESTEDF